MKKRVVFLMSDTGGGHRAAAEAIRDAMMARYDGQVECSLIDVFREYSPFPYKYMPEMYPWIINHSKSSWGVGYKLSNTRRSAKTLARGMYITMESSIKQMLRDHPADVVVCVHSLLTRVSLQAMLALERRPPYVVVVTDLVSTHMFWYDRRAETTLVPTQAAYDRGLMAGLRPDQMKVTGLPVHPRFAQGLKDKAVARRELGWNPDLPAVLIVGGGEGMGPIMKTARAINERGLRCQLAIVAGRNAALKAELEACHWSQPTHIFGFVSDMPRVMGASDILVTKAGPATISEACIAGLPCIIYDAIPGQETGNVEYVVSADVGLFTPSPRETAQAVEGWLSEGPAGLEARRRRALALGRPNAVWEIAEETWAYAQHEAITRQKRTLLQEMDERLSRLIPLP
jgi:1,2-diacylglycerol 3-beta-galactosyltransferase